MPDLYPLREFENISLAIMPRPRAGDWLPDEIAAWQAAGVRTVVSLLESQEVFELGLGDEAALCDAHGIEFISFPIPDRGVPTSQGALMELVLPLVPKITDGHLVAVHCRAGIGRSAVVAAGLLLQAGVPLTLIFPALSRARGVQVPDTDAQIEWVQAFARGKSPT